jgi:CHAT domain-containing protein
MTALYAARFGHGLATDEAMRSASLEQLTELRRSGRATPPYAWAAFVAAGDWR